MNEEWLKRMAELEDGCSITAGVPDRPKVHILTYSSIDDGMTILKVFSSLGRAKALASIGNYLDDKYCVLTMDVS